MSTITVNVTQEIIDRSKELLKEYNPLVTPRTCNCPVALALNAATKRQWQVTAHSAWTYDAQFGMRFIVPLEVTEKIFEFDKLNDIKPFNFEAETYLW